MTGDEALEGRGQVGVRVDAVQFTGLDQGGDHRPMLGTAVGAREERILAIEGNLGVILPMSGLRSRSTTAGTRFTGVGFGGTTANSALLASLFMSRRSLALS